MAITAPAATQPSLSRGQDLLAKTTLLLSRTPVRQRILTMLAIAAALFTFGDHFAASPISITVTIGSTTDPVEMEPEKKAYNESEQAEAHRDLTLPGSNKLPRPNTTVRILLMQPTDDEIDTDKVEDVQSTTQTAVIHLSPILIAGNVLTCILAVLCLMQAPQGQQRNSMGRVPDPPSYDPAHERTASFRHYTQ